MDDCVLVGTTCRSLVALPNPLLQYEAVRSIGLGARCARFWDRPLDAPNADRRACVSVHVRPAGNGIQPQQPSRLSLSYSRPLSLLFGSGGGTARQRRPTGPDLRRRDCKRRPKHVLDEQSGK
jgi:hypothetical protein